MTLGLYRFSFFEHDDDLSTTIAILPAYNDIDAFKKGIQLLPEQWQYAPDLAVHCAEQRGEPYDPDVVETAFFSANEIESLDELVAYAGDWWGEHAKLFGSLVLPPTPADLAHTITALLT